MKTYYMLMVLLSLFGSAFSQSPSWIGEWSNNGNGNFSGWVPSSADVYRPIAFTSTESKDLLFINISTGWAVAYWYGVNSSLQLGWWPVFSNNGNTWLNNTYSGWHIGSTDAYIVIENPGNKSYVLSLVRSGGWAMISQPTNNGSNYYFTQPWSNGGNGWIGGWHIDPNDKYVSGNFHGGTSQHEVFFMNPNGHAALNYFSGSGWINVWGNGGNGNLSGQWNISSSDQYFAFDYDGNGIDELLCINVSNSTAKILSNNGSAWTTVWMSTNGYLSTRPINNGGVFKVNKFKESGNADQLMILKNTSPYYASLHEFSIGGGWVELWNNGGSQSITGWGWLMGSGDAYIVPNRKLVAMSSPWTASSRFDWYPSIPQNLSVSATPTGEPKLTWDVSPDFDVAGDGLHAPNPNGIQIWKRIFNGVWHAYNQIASIAGNSSTYTDNTIGNAGNGPFTAEYKIRAVDNSGLMSSFTTPVQIAYGLKEEYGHNVLITIIPPSEFVLEQNYPNPFNPTTTIRYGLPKDTKVRITVSDLLGRVVAEIVNKEQAAGYHEIQFDASKLASGTYIYKLEAERNLIVKKMLLLK